MLLMLLMASCVRKPVPASVMPAYAIQAEAVYQDTVRRLRGRVNIRLLQDSVVWMSVTKFGIEALRLRITPTQIEWLNRLDHSHVQYRTDSLFPAEFKTQVFSLWSAILLGQLPTIAYDSRQKRSLHKQLGPSSLHTILTNPKQVASHSLRFPPYALQVDYVYKENNLHKINLVASTATQGYRLQLTYNQIRGMQATNVPFEVPTSYEKK